MLIFECPSCTAKMQAAEEHAGKTTVCPDCKTQVKIPSNDGITADPIASGAASNPEGITTPDQARSARQSDRDDDDDRDSRRPERRDGASAASGAAVGMSVGLIIVIVVGVLGCVGVAVVGILVALLVPAVQKVREAAARTQTTNNMRQIGLGIHFFHDNNKKFPSPKLQPTQPFNAKVSDLSWRVSILPYIDQQQMFEQFDKNSAWDHANNQRFINSRPKVYEHVSRADLDNSKTAFQYFTGPNTLFPEPERSPFKLQTIPDGSSNVFLFAEAQSGVSWSKPEDMVVTPNGPLPLPADRFLAAMGDGTVRMIERRKSSDQTLRMVIDPADAGILPLDWN